MTLQEKNMVVEEKLRGWGNDLEARADGALREAETLRTEFLRLLVVARDLRERARSFHQAADDQAFFRRAFEVNCPDPPEKMR